MYPRSVRRTSCVVVLAVVGWEIGASVRDDGVVQFNALFDIH
jgi:hypothetical protein